MEEYAEERCNLVYFVARSQDDEDVYELYHKRSAPERVSKDGHEDWSLQNVYQNVRTLLDEDQGGFDEVFICTTTEQCLGRLDTYANSVSTVVLVELPAAPDGQQATPASEHNGKDPLQFLRTLSADVQGARFQKSVMPFALLMAEEIPRTDGKLDPATTASYLHAGAIDIVHSPLQSEDLTRLLGHVKEMIRPPAGLVGAPMAQNLVNSIRDNSEPGVATHRPDQRLPSERRMAVEGAVQNWHFPAQDFDADELSYGVLCVLEHILSRPELAPYGLSRPQLITFLLATRRQYKHEREVHYHNWRHAVDVTQSMYCFLLDVGVYPPIDGDERQNKEHNGVERILTPLDGLILIVSAIGHDVGHPGVNNAFLVACNHPLAQIYNDKSVLENYHCAAYSQLLRRHWPSLHKIAGFRATMISTILATDMQRHFEYMANIGELRSKIDNSEANVADWSDKDRQHTRELLMALLMKAADISNVARPFEISAKWAGVLMNEFARQGELESELQIPTCLFGGPPDKEDLLAAAQSQKGFMSLFGFPLFQGIAEIMPSMSNSVRELENNRKIWDQKIEDEMSKRWKNTPLTLTYVTAEEVEQATAHHRSEPRIVPIETAQVPSTPTKRAAAPGGEISPSKHAAHDLRQHMIQGLPMGGDPRASSPFLSSPGMPFPIGIGGPSRRSSKDVALDHMQQLDALSHQSASNPGSRRGSADASWQIRQSCPGSRRGSKDESLTTILISGGTPNMRNTSSSPGRKMNTPVKPTSKRQSISHGQKQAAAASGRTSFPSSWSQANSTTTSTTAQHSPSTQQSTQPSSPDEEATPLAPHHQSVAATEDPFMMPGNWPNDVDGSHRASVQQGLPMEPQSTSSSELPLGKSDLSQVVERTVSDETDDTRSTPQKGDRGVRESRSRSRLRSLKFWKKRKDVTSVDTASADSTPSSP